ncbi:MAG: hypothetical protein ABIR66_13405 [Saprospiraceae bacterium]
MPQFDFIINEKERIKVIQFAFKNGCKIVPGGHYQTNTYPEITNISGYEKNCKDDPLLFLLNEKYSFNPLEFDSFTKENKKTFFLQQRHGGPAIDFFSPIHGERQNKIVGPGLIAIYPTYYVGDKTVVPNKEFKDIYNLLTGYIKRISIKIELNIRTFYLGNNTAQQAKRKELTILPISDIDILKLIN